MKLFTKRVVPIVLFVLAFARTVRAATYVKHASCNVEYKGGYCGVRYTTGSDGVTNVPGDKCLECYDGYAESSCGLYSEPYKAYKDGGSVADKNNCRWTGCSLGGCASDEIKKDSKWCGLNYNEYCCKKLPTWRCCYVKDCREPPTCPTTATACSTVCAAQGHGSYNHGLLNGVCFCNVLQSNQERPVCNSPGCDASSAPTNGGVGTCTSSLARGSSCQPTCNAGYTVSGTTTCSSLGTLTRATCALTPSACDASSAPTNGGVGTCTSSLARGSSCQPTCNTGYTVSGTTTCSSSGTLTRATCALTSTSSSGDCKCSCCSSNSCTASVVGYFDAGSSSSCTNDACRTQFPSQCPSLGSSGIVSSIYTSPTSPSSAWSLQNGDSLTLSSNSCSAAYTRCQATCAQGYSVSLSGAAYTLTPTASSSSLPSGCSCYTLGPATPTTSTWSGSIPVGPGASVRGTVTETSATTYTVVLSTTPSPCTLTYTKSTGGSLGASSGASRRTRTFTFAALIAGALTLF